jgi:Ca2+-binding EF-hand superfamily protein
VTRVDAPRQVDADRSGSLDTGEIMALAESLGKALEPAELEEVLAEMRAGELVPAEGEAWGEVTFDQFFRWWEKQQGEGQGGGMFGRLFTSKKRQEKKAAEAKAKEEAAAAATAALMKTAREAFDGADADGGGTLDAKEITALADSLGKVRTRSAIGRITHQPTQ